MTATVEKLFLHVSEKSFHPYLDLAEYNQYAHAEEKTETKLRQLLPPDQLKLLDELRQNWEFCSSITQEAAFQAGLAIGQELSRL
ncbi:MAG: hypothetical protein HDT14_06330 [Oscillibacter sp.]|nr:hypothetical protein [Oscillibacter sp.]